MGKLKHLKIKRADKIGMLFFFSFVLATTLIWLFEERFNVEQWKTQPRMRYKMADDIIESKILIGKTKQEIINLLGYSIVSNLNGKEVMQYKLGKSPSFGAEKRETLIIYFENKKVSLVVRAQE